MTSSCNSASDLQCPNQSASNAVDHAQLSIDPWCVVEPAEAVMEMAADPKALLRLVDPRNHIEILKYLKPVEPKLADVAAELDAFALALPSIPDWNAHSRSALASITYGIMIFSVLPFPNNVALRAKTFEHIYIPKDSFTEEKQDGDDDKKCKAGQEPDAKSPECGTPNCEAGDGNVCTVFWFEIILCFLF
ncbi:hypothetical protein BDV96DRAFT_309511 [Lophiotrema nucula]|uniref:Uncharacterized protein n=1 Tax=Lophiotrema nucula TaxID=690887 RepID=A0A6A5YI14_9PLEO|nr:hypothetical protein BDV96DRAFT_309511 [Lophiotrema nucula]